jgi:hypothetical protein
MECQFALVFNQNFCWIAHKFAASQFDVTRECSCKHHDLLIVRGLFENFLDIASHAFKQKSSKIAR